MAHLSLIDVPVEGCATRLPVHLSRPPALANGTCNAAVIVCHHACGIYHDDFLKRYCDALAQCGLLAALPDFYHRTWPNCDAKVAETRGEGLNGADIPVPTLIKGVSDRELLADVAAVVRHLENTEGVTAIGVTGFCLGGRTAFLASCSVSKIRACCMCHGGNLDVALDGSFVGLAKMAIGQFFGSRGQRWLVPGFFSQTPFAMRSTLRCPVMGHFGALDSNPSPADAENLRVGLADAGNDNVECFVYPDAKHGFCCGDSTSYHQAGADLAWQRTAAFMVQTLTPGTAVDIPPAPSKSGVRGNECTSGCAQIAAAAGR